MKDRFSDHAKEYSIFRPVYPQQLYDFIYQQVDTFGSAWDAGTGNGQVARELAKRFAYVEATDISQTQIDHAFAAPNINYSIAGERTTFKPESFELITVAQAIHWFDHPVFFREVKRVLKSNGVVAVWGYGLLKVNSDADRIVEDFYSNVVGPFWDAERKFIDHHYSTIPFPFEELPCPRFEMKFEWSRSDLFGYLNTWSSVKKYTSVKGHNPVDYLIKQLESKIDEDSIEVTFPLFLRLGRHSH